MRPVLYGDVSNAARVLLAVPASRRAALCRQLLREAEAADRLARDSGRLHPRWGNGSLMAVSRRHVMAPEPSFDDPEYRECFGLVLKALSERSFSHRQKRS